VAIAIAHTSTTWPRLADAPELGISVLSDGHAELCRTLSSPVADRFADTQWRTTPRGAVHITGAALTMTATIDAIVRAGDHCIVVLALQSLDSTPDVTPLVFHDSGFRRLQP
jgi:flavin reductase (DIM6/NTAB) family NADH-FMN oxidoreductase RutF